MVLLIKESAIPIVWIVYMIYFSMLWLIASSSITENSPTRKTVGLEFTLSDRSTVMLSLNRGTASQKSGLIFNNPMLSMIPIRSPDASVELQKKILKNFVYPFLVNSVDPDYRHLSQEELSLLRTYFNLLGICPEM